MLDSRLTTYISQAVKGELQPKIIFCLLTSFSTKERQIKRFPPHRRGSVENSGRKIAIFSAAVAARVPDIIDSSGSRLKLFQARRSVSRPSRCRLWKMLSWFGVWLLVAPMVKNKNTKKRNVSLYWHPVILVSGGGRSVALWNWLTQRSLTRVTDAEY